MIYTCVKRSTTRIVSFCSRKKRFFLQVLYSICILDANDVLTVCDLTQIVGCYWELVLERRREILWNRKRMFYRAVAWPPKMRIYYRIWYHLLPTQSMGDSPGEGGGGNNFLMNKFCSQKDFLSSSYIHMYQVDSSLGFQSIRKELNKSESPIDITLLIQTLSFYKRNHVLNT